MDAEDADKKWDLMLDLRKEMVEAQKLRAQIIGFKITFLSTGAGLIIATLGKVPNIVWAIPALAAIFFDLLINNYSFGIDRIAFYCRKYLEPSLKQSYQGLQDIPLWEEFVDSTQYKQKLSFIGNFGITLLTVVVAIVALFMPFQGLLSIALLILLIGLLVHDFNTFIRPKRLDRTVVR